MSSKISIGIPEPCHENWNQMTPVEQGRYCASCQKTVIDFTYSSDREILEHLSRSGEQVCGRFENGQLNRTLATTTANSYSSSARFSLLMAGMIAWSVMQAQTDERNVKGRVVLQGKPSIQASDITVPVTLPTNLEKITGTIVDAKTLEPIPYASVLIKGTRNGVAADAKGRFVLTAMFEGQKQITLQVSCIGFKPLELQVGKSKGELRFYLDPASELVGEVVINGTALPLVCDTTPIVSHIVGMIVQRHEPDLQEKLNRKVEPLVPAIVKSKNITIHPNPVTPGEIVKLTFNPGRTGAYTIDIFDSNGILMQRKFIDLKENSELFDIQTSRGWSSGLYWVRITGKNGKVYQTKLLIR